MPKQRTWTPAEIERLWQSNGTVSSNVLAREFSCCRWTVLCQERALGIVRAPRKLPEKPRETRSRFYATPPFPRDEQPLKAGHPESWQLLMRHTPCLDGAPFG